MKKLSLPVFLLAMLCLMISCKGDDEPAQPDKETLLTQNEWEAQSIQIDPPLGFTDQNGDSVSVSELFTILEDCAKDNRLTFTSSGSYSLDEGAAKCQAGAPQTYEEGNWELNKSENALFFSPATPQNLSPYKKDILQLTGKQLILEQQVQANGKPHSLTTVYRAVK